MEFSNKKILVVVAHPDDEVLGCGATIHKLVKKYSCTIRVVILGEGLTSRSNLRDKQNWQQQLILHKKNIDEARSKIGYESTAIYEFPDNRFDSVDLLDIVKVIESEKNNFEPEIIFTHHGGDLNIDHQRTFEAVMTASRPVENETVKTIITFETPSGTEWQAPNDPRSFRPNVYLEVGAHDVQSKIDAMECYQFENRNYPHPRSPESLKLIAQHRGVQMGLEYSEAFMLIRSII